MTMMARLMTSDKFYNNNEAVILIVNDAFPDTVRYSDLQMKNCRYSDFQMKKYKCSMTIVAQWVTFCSSISHTSATSICVSFTLKKIYLFFRIRDVLKSCA